MDHAEDHGRRRHVRGVLQRHRDAQQDKEGHALGQRDHAETRELACPRRSSHRQWSRGFLAVRRVMADNVSVYPGQNTRPGTTPLRPPLRWTACVTGTGAIVRVGGMRPTHRSARGWRRSWLRDFRWRRSTGRRGGVCAAATSSSGSHNGQRAGRRGADRAAGQGVAGLVHPAAAGDRAGDPRGGDPADRLGGVEVRQQPERGAAALRVGPDGVQAVREPLRVGRGARRASSSGSARRSTTSRRRSTRWRCCSGATRCWRRSRASACGWPSAGAST